MEKQQITTSDKLQQAEQNLKNWYDNEFLPFKKQKEQEKADFTTFANIVKQNPNEIKFMLANIYDKNYEDVIKTWNKLNLEPTITDIKQQDDLLVIKDENKEELSINFDNLLDNISKILGG